MSASKGLFKKYPNAIFIETGSCVGDGIQQALDEGFEEIYSVELLPLNYIFCSNRFKDVPEVTLIYGDSVKALEGMLSRLKVPATFWLDAHNGAESTPLLRELEVINNHHIKTHTILIDDLRDWKVKYHGFDTEILKQKLLEINPNYKISLEEGYVPNDILAATI